MMGTKRHWKYIAMNIGELIEVSGYRVDYLSGKLGLTMDDFSEKKKGNTFAAEELKELMAIIANDDVLDYLMAAEMDRRQNEPTITYEELSRLMKWNK